MLVDFHFKQRPNGQLTVAASLIPSAGQNTRFRSVITCPSVNHFIRSLMAGNTSPHELNRLSEAVLSSIEHPNMTITCNNVRCTRKDLNYMGFRNGFSLYSTM
jgi:hypothetical protein